MRLTTFTPKESAVKEVKPSSSETRIVIEDNGIQQVRIMRKERIEQDIVEIEFSEEESPAFGYFQ